MTRHRTVGDLMTHTVVCVRSDTPFKEIVRLLSDHDITALPVVDEDERPLGVVSEADLLHRESTQPDPTGLLALLDDPGDGPVRPAGTTAGELMTSPAVSARPEWTVVQAARVMEGNRVKRLPVVDGTGRLVGILSRADLLRVFLRHDRAIREEISGDVLSRTLGISADEVVVGVLDGRVTLRGTVEHRGLIPVAIRLCEGVDGVIEVTETLDYRIDEAPAVAASSQRRAGLSP